MTSNKAGRGVNSKGRSTKGGKFVRLGNGMLTSEAWRSLSGSAIKYYVELRREFNGFNNGSIHLSLEEAKKRLSMGKSTTTRAQQELVNKGFIRMTKRGGFHQRMATTWALTDEASPATQPTHDYKNWQPKKNPSVPKQDRARSRNRTDNVVLLPSSVLKQDRKTPV